MEEQGWRQGCLALPPLPRRATTGIHRETNQLQPFAGLTSGRDGLPLLDSRLAAPTLMNFSRLVVLSVALSVSVFADDKVTFNEHIRPILANNCFACHGSDASHREAKLRLDTAAGATAEKNGLRAITPRDLENSELWHRITSSDPDEVMPPADSNKQPLK